MLFDWGCVKYREFIVFWGVSFLGNKELVISVYMKFNWFIKVEI